MKPFIVFTVITFLLSAVVYAAKPWFSPFTALRTRFVSPTAAPGTGDGSQANPFNLHTAANRGFGRPGDLYVLLDGTYLPNNGNFLFKCDGNVTNPCVFKCPGHCVLHGMIQVYANYLWLWGVEVTDPGVVYSGSAGTSCPIGMWAGASRYTGVRIINNFIHDMSNATVFRNAICSYADYQTVLYGNIAFGEGHNLYVSNTVDHGYKYIVNNMFMDCRGGSLPVPLPGGGTFKYFNVHAYVEAETHGMGQLTGLYFSENIMKDGRYLLGSAYLPDHHNEIHHSTFMNSRLQVGYGTPAQAIVEDNLLGYSILQYQFLWGEGETQFPYPGISSSVTGNTVINPSDIEGATQHVLFGAKSYQSSSSLSAARIRAGDTWDRNCYSSTFHASATAASGTLSNGDPAAWQAFTTTNGVSFDQNSNFACTVPAVQVVMYPNDYDPTRVHVAVFNHAQADAVTIDVCSQANTAPWLSWKLYHFKSIYGSPLSHGARAHCQISLSMAGKKYDAYLLVRSDVEDPTDPITSSMGDWLPPPSDPFGVDSTPVAVGPRFIANSFLILAALTTAAFC